MGYPCTDLISAAVLLSNPGITREEFVELLNQTHSTVITSVPEKAPWEFQKSKKIQIIYKQTNDNQYWFLQ